MLQVAPKATGKAFPLDVKAVLSVLNHLNVGVYITDRNRRIQLWNRKAERATGREGDGATGRRVERATGREGEGARGRLARTSS